MWKTLFNFVSSVFSITQRLQRQEEGLKDLQREVKQLTSAMQRLAFELQRTNDELRRVGDHGASEREKFMLRVENQLHLPTIFSFSLIRRRDNRWLRRKNESPATSKSEPAHR
jgi:hypothetical protein